MNSASIARNPVGRVAKAFSSSVNSLPTDSSGLREIPLAVLFLGLPRSMIDASDCSLRWPLYEGARDKACSDWFRKWPPGGAGGAEVGTAERGVSHGFLSVRAVGAVLGASMEDRFEDEPELLEGVV